MDSYAHGLLIEVLIQPAFSWCSAVRSWQRTTQDARNVDVHEASKREAKHCAAKNKKQDEVVGFGEAEEFRYAHQGAGDAALGRGLG